MKLSNLLRAALPLIFAAGFASNVWGLNLDATFRSAGTFGALMESLREAGLESRLAEQGPYTILAPSDEAFAKLSSDVRERMRTDKPWAKRVMQNHIVQGKHLINGPGADKQFSTEAGVDLSLSEHQGMWSIGGAEVLEPDVEVDNGVIHVIDHVLLPPQ